MLMFYYVHSSNALVGYMVVDTIYFLVISPNAAWQVLNVNSRLLDSDTYWLALPQMAAILKLSLLFLMPQFLDLFPFDNSLPILAGKELDPFV